MGLKIKVRSDEPVVIIGGDGESKKQAFFQFQTLENGDVGVLFKGTMLVTDKSGKRIGERTRLQSGDPLDFLVEGYEGSVDVIHHGRRTSLAFDAPKFFFIEARYRND